MRRWVVWSKQRDTKQRAGSRGCSAHTTKIGVVIRTSHSSLFAKLQEMQLRSPLAVLLSPSLCPIRHFLGLVSNLCLFRCHLGLLRLNLSFCQIQLLLSCHLLSLRNIGKYIYLAFLLVLLCGPCSRSGTAWSGTCSTEFGFL